MTPTDFAAHELALWEQALRKQRRAEEELDAARRRRGAKRITELMPQLQALRTRADLLLAEAVKMKLSYRAQSIVTDWGNTTQPGAMHDGASA